MTDHSDLIENFARAVSLRCHSHPGEERRSATERANLAKQALVDALSSQSLSLSEARERGDEYERLYRQTHLDYVAAEYRLDAISAAIGSPRFMDPPDGGDVSLADQVRRMRAELEAKEARLEALENGPAGLADAHSNPASSDLSSLRKGAEVAVDEIVTRIYRRFKDWSERKFSADDVTWCEVKADVLGIIALVSGSREDGA